jgi:hypothetical protein
MLETKLLKERKDSLQITRYLIDKMGEDRFKVGGWLSMLDGSDVDISEYGMSMNQLNGTVMWGNRLDKFRIG